MIGVRTAVERRVDIYTQLKGMWNDPTDGKIPQYNTYNSRRRMIRKEKYFWGNVKISFQLWMDPVVSVNGLGMSLRTEMRKQARSNKTNCSYKLVRWWIPNGITRREEARETFFHERRHDERKDVEIGNDNSIDNHDDMLVNRGWLYIRPTLFSYPWEGWIIPYLTPFGQWSQIQSIRAACWKWLCE